MQEFLYTDEQAIDLYSVEAIEKFEENSSYPGIQTLLLLKSGKVIYSKQPFTKWIEHLKAR